MKFVLSIVIAFTLIGLGYFIAVKTRPETEVPKFATSTLTFPRTSTPKPATQRREFSMIINQEGTNFAFVPSEFTVKIGEPIMLSITNNASACEFTLPEKNINEPIAAGEEIKVGVTPMIDTDLNFYCAENGQQAGSGGVIHVTR